MKITKYKDYSINENYTEKDFIRYKMRAEANIDALNLLNELDGMVSRYSVDNILNMNIVIDLNARYTLKELLAIIKEIPDAHVMYRSLNYANEFTGDDVRSN
jgi:hypothetical protein